MVWTKHLKVLKRLVLLERNLTFFNGIIKEVPEGKLPLSEESNLWKWKFIWKKNAWVRSTGKCLALNLMTGVQSTRPSWWKERTDLYTSAMTHALSEKGIEFLINK